MPAATTHSRLVATANASEMDATFEQQKSALEGKKREADQDCDREKLSDDYKDKFKKIEIDYKCSSKKNNLLYEGFKIDMELSFRRDALTGALLNDIFMALAKSTP
jgi:hypothetical protein